MTRYLSSSSIFHLRFYTLYSIFNARSSIFYLPSYILQASCTLRRARMGAGTETRGQRERETRGQRQGQFARHLWGCLGQSWNPLGGILGRPLNGPLPKSDQKSSWNDLGSSWAVRIAIWILGIPTRWMDRHGSSPAAQVRWRLLLTKRAHGALLGQSRSSFVAIGPVARRKRIWKIT